MEVPNLDLAGKVAIVTGGAKGLGVTEALALALAGADVALVDRDFPACQETAAKLREETGRRIVPVNADVSVEADVARMVESTVAELGRIDILVNNAALVSRKPAMELDVQDFDEVMAVNARGQFLCSKAVAQQMIKQGQGGKIVNQTSIAAFLGEPNRVAYSASKAAQEVLTKSFAVELGQYGIHVNSIAGGIFDAGMSANTLKLSPKFHAHLRERIVFHRPGTPEEMARFVVFLASPASDYMTGQAIILDGGMMAH